MNKSPVTSLRPIWAILMSFCSFWVSAQNTWTVETIPNVKLITNSYVSNPDSLLTASSVETLNSKLAQLERETTVQVAVVAVRSIGNEDIFDFAQKLFKLWGIGQAKKDNGLLILFVLDQRTVRFHTGFGLEGVLPDAVCKEIQMQNMIPSFRNEDYNQGIIYGVDEVVYVLSNESYRNELMDNSRREVDGWTGFFPWALYGGGMLILIGFMSMHWTGSFGQQKKKVKGKGKEKPKEAIYPEMKLSRQVWLILFAAVPMGLLLFFQFFPVDTDNHILVFLLWVYVYFIVTLFYKRLRMKTVTDKFVESKNYFGAATFFNDYQVYWVWMAVLFPLPFFPLYYQYLSRKKFYRNHPRNCKSCGQPAVKLDEKADDQYLKKSQVFEEELKSVDYDVWLCKSCQATEILSFVNRFSQYSICSSCHAKALFTESRRTVVEATYDSSGSGEQTDRCKFCGKTHVTAYSIAQLTRSSDSSSSSSGGGSSGGSWGGGDSGGGGASSSW